MIIGISGKIGSGKDTVANILSNMYPNVKILHFGDSLKDIISIVFNINRSILDTQEGKKAVYPKLGITNREILQKLGSLFRQTFYENIWIDNVLDKITSDNIVYVIADVRYPNEKKAIEDAGGIVIRIERPGIPTIDHISETALDNAEFHKVIYNDGNIEQLEFKINSLINNYH